MAHMKAHSSSQQKHAGGRPRTGKARLQLKLAPQTIELIRQRAASAELSMSEYVEHVVHQAEKVEVLRELLRSR
jgi:hypothetical protein